MVCNVSQTDCVWSQTEGRPHVVVPSGLLTGHPLAISPTPLDISGKGGIMRCEAEKINEDTQKRLNKPLTFLYCCVIIVPENERGFNDETLT